MIIKKDLFGCFSAEEKNHIRNLSRVATMFSIYRYNRNLTQFQLAEILGISERTAIDVECGDYDMSVRELSDWSFKLDWEAINICRRV